MVSILCNPFQVIVMCYVEIYLYIQFDRVLNDAIIAKHIFYVNLNKF